MSGEGGLVVALTVYLLVHHRRRAKQDNPPEPVVALKPRQRPDEAALRLSWHAGRALPEDQREIDLTMGMWEALPMLDWDHEENAGSSPTRGTASPPHCTQPTPRPRTPLRPPDARPRGAT
jgi:hypothetical protein